MMTRDQIQTVLNALQNSQLFVQASSNINVLEGFGQQLDDADEAIALLRAFLAEPSEPIGYAYENQDFIGSVIGAKGDWAPHEIPLFTHPASNHLDEIAKVLHYPDCWDTAAYPTLEDAIIEAKSWAHCTNEDCQCPTKDA